MKVDIKVEETGIPHGVRRIAEQLPRSTEFKAGDEVNLVFSGKDFVYLTGLTLLACWRKSLPAGVNLRIDDRACQEATRSFLTNTGFREIIEAGRERPSARARVGKIPLQPIINRLSVEATVAEITGIFDEFTGQVADTNPFRTLLSELGENVLAHSESISPGYACARVLPGSDLRAEICLCDSGIGIRQSFLRGTNPEAIERIERGANPLEIAVEGLTSSKPHSRPGSWKSYFGFGLYITRRLVQVNRGQMTIMSGDQELIIGRHDMEARTLEREFSGTFIGIVLDLANPLPLDEIYEEANRIVVGPKTTISKSKDRKDKSRATTVSTAQLPESSTKLLDRPLRADELQLSPPASAVQLKHYGTELLTREVGTVIRADLATQLVNEKTVVVTLDGITDITPSVVDEAFGKLAEAMGFEAFSKRVTLQGGSPLVNRLIEFVLKARSSRAH